MRRKGERLRIGLRRGQREWHPWSAAVEGGVMSVGDAMTWLQAFSEPSGHAIVVQGFPDPPRGTAGPTRMIVRARTRKLLRSERRRAEEILATFGKTDHPA